jgi:hypothetical protein
VACPIAVVALNNMMWLHSLLFLQSIISGVVALNNLWLVSSFVCTANKISMVSLNNLCLYSAVVALYLSLTLQYLLWVVALNKLRVYFCLVAGSTLWLYSSVVTFCG